MSFLAPTGENKVSVIVPVYRAEAYLARCVDSLTNQTYKNIEIILVDDGSPDNCPAMCDAYAESDERIKVIHKENGGLVSAWQRGVTESAGDYLCFVDSDDWIELCMIEKMLAYTSKVPALAAAEAEGGCGGSEIICCNFVINRVNTDVHADSGSFNACGGNSRNNKKRETKHYHGLPPGVYEGGRLEQEIKNNLLGNENRTISMSRCMKLFSRALIEDNMRFCNPKVTMGEDVSITLLALLDCRRVVIMEEAHYYHYFYNEASMVHKYDKGMYEGILMLYSNIKEVFRAKGRANGEDQSNKEFIYLLFLALKNELRGGRPGYAARIKEICTEEETVRLVREYPVKVRDKAGRLLYFILKNPRNLYIRLMRIVFGIYDTLS